MIEHTLALPERAVPPPADLLALVPPRFWRALGAPALRDRLLELLRETDFDVVYFRDLDLLAAAPRDALGRAAVLQMPPIGEARGGPERWREQRFLVRLARRAAAVACSRSEDIARLMAWDHRICCRAVDPSAPDALAALLRSVAEETASA